MHSRSQVSNSHTAEEEERKIGAQPATHSSRLRAERAENVFVQFNWNELKRDWKLGRARETRTIARKLSPEETESRAREEQEV